MQTSESAEATTSSASMSSSAASLARTSPMPVCVPVLRANAADCGARCTASFASYNPASCSWRTSQLCLDGAWAEFLETWPRSGMTRSGKSFQLLTSGRTISENASGAWPTPRTGDGMTQKLRVGSARLLETGHKGRLEDAVALKEVWPTPRANDAEKRGNFDVSNPRNGLPAKAKMFPTPTVSTGSFQQSSYVGAPRRYSLMGMARHANWPTPAAQDAKNSTLPPSQMERDTVPGALLRSGEKAGGQLNPTWVEWLMGYPPGWTDLEGSATP